MMCICSLFQSESFLFSLSLLFISSLYLFSLSLLFISISLSLLFLGESFGSIEMDTLCGSFFFNVFIEPLFGESLQPSPKCRTSCDSLEKQELNFYGDSIVFECHRVSAKNISVWGSKYHLFAQKLSIQEEKSSPSCLFTHTQLNIGRLKKSLKTERENIPPLKLFAAQVKLSPCLREDSPIQFSIDQVQITGQSMTLKRPQLIFLGTPLFTLPDYQHQLTRDLNLGILQFGWGEDGLRFKGGLRLPSLTSLPLLSRLELSPYLLWRTRRLGAGVKLQSENNSNIDTQWSHDAWSGVADWTSFLREGESSWGILGSWSGVDRAPLLNHRLNPWIEGSDQVKLYTYHVLTDDLDNRRLSLFAEFIHRRFILRSSRMLTPPLPAPLPNPLPLHDQLVNDHPPRDSSSTFGLTYYQPWGAHIKRGVSHHGRAVLRGEGSWLDAHDLGIKTRIGLEHIHPTRWVELRGITGGERRWLTSTRSAINTMAWIGGGMKTYGVKEWGWGQHHVTWDVHWLEWGADFREEVLTREELLERRLWGTLQGVRRGHWGGGWQRGLTISQSFYLGKRPTLSKKKRHSQNKKRHDAHPPSQSVDLKLWMGWIERGLSWMSESRLQLKNGWVWVTTNHDRDWEWATVWGTEKIWFELGGLRGEGRLRGRGSAINLSADYSLPITPLSVSPSSFIISPSSLTSNSSAPYEGDYMGLSVPLYQLSLGGRLWMNTISPSSTYSEIKTMLMGTTAQAQWRGQCSCWSLTLHHLWTVGGASEFWVMFTLATPNLSRALPLSIVR